MAAVHWPKQRDEEQLEKFDAIIRHIEAGLQVRLLVLGYLAGKLHAAVAARLIPAGLVEPALELVPFGQRGEWAAALTDSHPDEIAVAASAVMTPESYDLDVAAALAPTRPDAAFAGVRPAWPQLAPDQRDGLVALIEQYGDANSIDPLSAVIEDDHRDNVRRRARAARRIGALLKRRDDPRASARAPQLECARPARGGGRGDRARAATRRRVDRPLTRRRLRSRRRRQGGGERA